MLSVDPCRRPAIVLCLSNHDALELTLPDIRALDTGQRGQHGDDDRGGGVQLSGVVQQAEALRRHNDLHAHLHELLDGGKDIERVATEPGQLPEMDFADQAPLAVLQQSCPAWTLGEGHNTGDLIRCRSGRTSGTS